MCLAVTSVLKGSDALLVYGLVVLAPTPIIEIYPKKYQKGQSQRSLRLTWREGVDSMVMKSDRHCLDIISRIISRIIKRKLRFSSILHPDTVGSWCSAFRVFFLGWHIHPSLLGGDDWYGGQTSPPKVFPDDL